MLRVCKIYMKNQFCFPSDSIILLESLKGCAIEKVFRFGNFSDFEKVNFRSKYSQTKGFVALSGCVCLKLSDNRMVAFCEVEDSNSIKVAEVDAAWLETETNDVLMNYDSDEGFMDCFLNRPVLDVKLIKSSKGNPKYKHTKNELGVALLLDGSGPDFSVGANLAKFGGYGWVMTISLENVDREFLGGFSLSSLN